MGRVDISASVVDRRTAGTPSVQAPVSLSARITAVWMMLSAYGANNVRRHYYRMDHEK